MEDDNQKIFDVAKIKKQSEDQLQMACANYLRLAHPRLFWCHIANERQTSPARGRKLKLMGVRAGMPDFIMFDWEMAIELKVGSNKLTPAQRECLKRFEDMGWLVYVCRSLDEFIKSIEDYLK